MDSYIFNSKIKLNIKGRKVERFLKKISTEKINLYKIETINRNEVNILILKKDYEKVLKLKTIYEVNILDGFGLIKVRKIAKLNSLFIVLISFAIIIVFFLSKVIFKIEVIHTDPAMRNFMIKELSNYGIKEKTLKKSYDEIQQIKSNILNTYKDKLEWLEIEVVGTKYIIRLEERKLNIQNQDYRKQNIVATKSAIIKKIEASSGQIVKEINSYVNKGDVIISGDIKLNEATKEIVRADGHVYGEVWYIVNISYPFVYNETKNTGKFRKVLSINFLGSKWNLSFSDYHDKKIEVIKSINHLFLPISITYEKQNEVQIIEEIYTVEQAIAKAEERGRQQIESKLNDKERIIDSKNLNVDIKDSKIELEMFFTVYEDITGYQEIDEEIVEE